MPSDRRGAAALRLLRVLAWLGLLAIAWVTLAPIGDRPITAAPPNFERFAAFAVISCIFALAYPRHLWIVAVVMVGAAIALELLQYVTPTRHGRPIDLAFKVLGALVGLGAAIALRRIFRRVVASRDDATTTRP